MRRVTGVAVLVLALVIVVAAAPAGACGGLVGENGTIQLTRTTTLAAYHDGVERYVTSFEFSGTGEELGSIVPLPAVPTKVERGGDWTLQRLQREVRPPVSESAFALQAGSATSDKAEVLQQTTVDALDITILRGGGDAVGEWAIDHGFLLTPDAPEVLDFYSQRSKIFMAARFDAARAERLGQQSGDGTPIMLTIPTDTPWVPLRILALGLDRTTVVDADVFLLTDERPAVLTADTGVEVTASNPASTLLLDDLRSDQHMGWIPDDMWFTYVNVAAPAGELRHDLAVSTRADTPPSVRLAGFVTDAGFAADADRGDDVPWGWFVLLVGAPLLLIGGAQLRAPAGVVTKVVRGHRLVALTIAVVVLLLGAGAAAVAGAGVGAGGSSPARASSDVLGPGPVTLTIDIDHSRFDVRELRVRPHTEVRFVLVNRDPIGHELIVGDPEVHARHANGHEAFHPPVDGEVSIPADARAATTYVFHAPGPVEFACHLPGHYQYGMRGIVEVTPDVS